MIKKNSGARGYSRVAKATGRTLATLSALSLAVGAALAQDSEPTRVIVTGSFIPTAETEGPLPVTVYTASQLQKAGAQTPAEGLRQLPSYIGATATENDSNAGNGSAFINLRGLGSGNTLTLINGRRTFNFADINAIGIGSINRTEILKDGASAIYGSDAVAGVVNFILLNGPGAEPFKGVEIDLLYGNTTNKDAGVRQGYINAGFVSTDGKFNLVFSANYLNREAIYAHDRRLSATADARSLGGISTLSGSYPGRYTLVTGNTFGFTGAANTRVLNDPTQLIGNNVAATTHTFNITAGDGFNFLAFAPAVPAQEKFNYYGAFNYKIFGDGRAILYGDAIYTETRQDNGLAPAPISQLSRANVAQGGLNGDQSIALQRAAYYGNPFNPFGNQLSAFRYRLVAEANNRRTGYDQKFYRYEGGLKGDLSFKGNSFISALNYDFGLLYEQYKQVTTSGGDANLSLLLAQYLAVPTTPAQSATVAGILGQFVSGGRLTQAIALNASNGGTFNPFRGLGAPAVGTAPIYVNGVQTGTRTFDNIAAVQRAAYIANAIDFGTSELYDAKFGGLLFPNLPQGGIGFNLGAEYRKENAKHRADPTQGVDPITGAGDPLGFNTDANSNYKRTTYSLFGELAIPVITAAMKVPFVRGLDFQAAIRYEHFENSGLDPRIVDPITGIPNGPKIKVSGDNGWTPRFTIRWQLDEQLTFRGSYGKSYIQPSFGQLFLPATQNFPVINDPLTGQNQQTPNGVYQSGNPALRPEKTDSFTAGMVFTPKFFKGFTLTIDYYQTNTRNLVLSPANAAQVLASLNAASGGTFAAINAADARRGLVGVFRDPDNRALNGQPNIDRINAAYLNSGKRLVEGVDIVANYQLPTAFGTFDWTLGYNHFFRWKASTGTPGLPATNFNGSNLTSIPLAPGAIPRNKGYFRTDWTYGGFELVGTINYIDSYHNDGAFLTTATPGVPPGFITNVVTGGTAAQPTYFTNRNSREYITLDLQASYEFKKPATAAATYAKDGKGVRTEVAQTTGGSFFQKLLWGTKIKVGVNNVFDTPPPFDAAAFNDNYDTSTYTIRNRYYYIGLNKKF